MSTIIEFHCPTSSSIRRGQFPQRIDFLIRGRAILRSGSIYAIFHLTGWKNHFRLCLSCCCGWEDGECICAKKLSVPENKNWGETNKKNFSIPTRSTQNKSKSFPFLSHSILSPSCSSFEHLALALFKNTFKATRPKMFSFAGAKTFFDNRISRSVNAAELWFRLDWAREVVLVTAISKQLISFAFGLRAARKDTLIGFRVFGSINFIKSFRRGINFRAGRNQLRVDSTTVIISRKESPKPFSELRPGNLHCLSEAHSKNETKKCHELLPG